MCGSALGAVPARLLAWFAGRGLRPQRVRGHRRS